MLCRDCGCEADEGLRCWVCGGLMGLGRDVPCEATLDNGLVRQKDWLIRRIDAARTPGDLSVCLDMLDMVNTLWSMFGYGYKATELANRVELRRAEMVSGKAVRGRSR